MIFSIDKLSKEKDLMENFVYLHLDLIFPTTSNLRSP